MLYFQERSPFPTDRVGVGRHMNPYVIVNDEGLVPEEYVSLIPEEMIPVALEAEMEESLEGEEVIWSHVPNEEEENQTETQVENCDCTHNVEEDDDDDDDDDEANYKHTENFTGSVNDHTYECTHDETKEAAFRGKDENENENQEVEDDINPN
ncbi:glutamic acid-rich protein-like [Mesocricetus auratus]|uniref:Glutamic acid-rich protein-like n=1 Tax=Mesocricetus auratus TaxID=10036 RepID=A0A3Q0D2C2_MESAU|nr:glutamic acid-rich protein-like [Mesocricetus auratus]XP_021086679.1 glutamic acid-rich protein-like [Mesocricetus auratus]